MTTQLLDGPGRTLECIHPKFMVDLVQGADAARHSLLGPQQLQFRERLTQEIITQTRLRPWAMAGMLNENAALRLGLAEKLAGMLDPGHLALTRMSDRLVALRQQVNPRLLNRPDCCNSTKSSPHISTSVPPIKRKRSRSAALRFRRVSTASKFLPAGEPGSMTAGRWLAAALSCWKSCAGGVWRCLSSGE